MILITKCSYYPGNVVDATLKTEVEFRYEANDFEIVTLSSLLHTIILIFLKVKERDRHSVYSDSLSIMFL